MPSKDNEELFAGVAIELGLLTAEQVEECRKAREALVKEGLKARSLPYIAEEKGFLTRQQHKQVLHELRKRGVYPRIGGYEIIRKVGAGAMGVVYEARQISLDRTVALKVLSPQLSRDALYVERFDREAKLAARLTHPHAVQIHDVGQEEGQHFIVMEYVAGQPLDRMLKEGPLQEQRALKIIHDVAKALDGAHAQGIIHRDIKPSNILIRTDGIAKLSDLGIAKEVGGATVATLTTPGAAIGTPRYMSPEQCSGEQDTDRRTDIYSLGITLYRTVCGKDPYCGTTPLAVIKQHISEPLPDPKSVNPNISDATAQLIRDMTQKEREVRLQSCQLVVERIEAILSGQATVAPASPPPLPRAAEPVQPPPAPPPTPTAAARPVTAASGPVAAAPRKARSKAPLIAVGVVVVIAAVAAGVFFVVQGRKQAEEKPPTAVVPPEQGEPGPDSADAKDRYTRLMMEAMDAEGAHDWAHALDLYRQARPLAEDVAQVDRAIARVTAAKTQEALLREYHGGVANGAEFAQQEKWAEAKAAYERGKAGADKMAAKPPGYQDLLTRLEEADAALRGETQRRDSLATYRGEVEKGARLMQEEKWGEAKAAYVNAQAAGGKLEPKPTGYEFLAELVTECDKQIAAAPPGEAQPVTPTGTATGTGIEMVFSGLERGEGGENRCLAFGSGGLGLACGRSDGTVSVWDLKGCRLLTTLSLTNSVSSSSSSSSSTTITRVAFSHDGELIAAAGYFNDAWLWQVASGRCTAIKGASYDVAFAPGSRLLATGGCPARLWDAKAGRVVADLNSRKGSSTYSNFVVFSGDGKALATGRSMTYSSSSRGTYTEKVVELWSLQTQKLVEKLEDISAPIALSFNGQLVAGQAGGNQIGVYDLAKRTSMKISVPNTAWSPSSSYSDIKDLVFHPRQPILACKTSNGVVTLLSLPSGKVLGTLKPGSGREGRIAFSPDGKLLASCYDYTSKRVDLWDVAKGSLLVSLAAVGKAKDYAIWTPEGYYVASQTAEFSISAKRGYMAVPRTEFKKLFNRPELVLAKLAGKDVPPPSAEGGEGAPAEKPEDESKAAEPEEEKRIAAPPPGIEKPEVAAPPVVAEPEPKKTAAGPDEETLRPPVKLYWAGKPPSDKGEGKKEATPPGEEKKLAEAGPVIARIEVTTPKVGEQPVAEKQPAMEDKEYPDEWQAELESKPVASKAGEPEVQLVFADVVKGQQVKHPCLAFSPVGGALCSAGPKDTVNFWSLKTGRLTGACRTQVRGLEYIAFSPDGELLAFAGESEGVELRQVSTGRTLTLGQGQHCATFSPDGTCVVTAGKPVPRVWDIGTGRLVAELRGTAGEWVRAVFTPDGQRVATSYVPPGKTSGQVTIWDLATKTSTAGIYGPGAALAVGPGAQCLGYVSGRWIYRAGPPGVGVSTSMSIDFRRAGSKVEDVAVHPTQPFVACITDGGEVKVCEPQVKKEVRSIQACPGRCRLAFNPDGKWLVTAGHPAGVVVLWNLEDGSRVLNLAPCGEGKDFVAWTPEGYYVASAGAEKKIQVKVWGKLEPLGDYGKMFHQPELVAKKLAGQDVPPPSGVGAP